MELTAIDVQTIHHQKTLALRKFDRIIQGSGFQDAYNTASEASKHTVLDIIHEDKLIDLKHWIRRHLYSDFKNHSVAELRTLASAHQIKYYSRLTKAELISKLIEKGLTDGGERHERDDYKSIEEDGAATYHSRHWPKPHSDAVRTTSNKNLR